MSNRLFWQQVGVGGGSSASALASAADLVSRGGDGIGLELTRWGERRQARLDKRRANAESEALHQIDMLLNNATTEDEVAEIQRALIGRGGLPEGTAGLVDAQLDSIFKNDISRSIARGNNASAEHRELGNDASRLKNTVDQNAFDFQKNEAAALTEITDLAIEGKNYDAQLDALRERTASTYGADVVNQAIRGALADRDTGSTSRHGDFTRMDERRNAELDYDKKDFDWQRYYEAAGRIDKEREDTEFLTDRWNDMLQTYPSADDARLAVNEMTDLTNEQKNIIQARIADGQFRVDVTQPDVQTTESIMQDLQRTAEITREAFQTGNFTQLQNVSASVGDIQANAQEIEDTVPGYSTWKTARRIREQNGGPIVNTEQFLREQFPDYDWEKQGVKFSERRIEVVRAMQTKYNLTNEATAAIAMRAMRNTNNFKDSMRSAAEEYSKVDKGQFGGMEVRLDQATSRATSLQIEIAAQEQRRRNATPGSAEETEAENLIKLKKRQLAETRRDMKSALDNQGQ